MALAFVQQNTVTDDANDTGAQVALTGVGAGNLIVLWVKWEGAAGATITASDGTSNFTVRPTNDHNGNNDLHGAFAYLLVANSGDKTFTVTWSAARPFKAVHVKEFS